jgi:hypothetical protein
MIKALRQKSTAGGQFDGTRPGGNPADLIGNDVGDWAAFATGGLFDPFNDGAAVKLTHPLWLERLTIKASASTAWTASIVQDDGTVVVEWSQTGTSFCLQARDRTVLFPGEKIKIVGSPGGSDTIEAMVVLSDRLIE